MEILCVCVWQKMTKDFQLILFYIHFLFNFYCELVYFSVFYVMLFVYFVKHKSKNSLRLCKKFILFYSFLFLMRTRRKRHGDTKNIDVFKRKVKNVKVRIFFGCFLFILRGVLIFFSFFFDSWLLYRITNHLVDDFHFRMFFSQKTIREEIYFVWIMFVLSQNDIKNV